MIALATQPWIDLRRWTVSAVVVLLAHGAIAAAISWTPANYVEQTFPFDFQNVGELAAPEEELSDAAPGPKQTESVAALSKPTESLEEKPEEKVETKPVEEVPKVPPAPNPEIPVEQVKELKQETPQRQEARQPAPATTAPVSIPDRVAAVASSQVPVWRGRMSGLLEHHKRYPEAARARREEGVVQLLFSLDRKGMVISRSILASSGSAALDEEALALLLRAQPFPPPPLEMPGEQVPVTVPIRFNLNARRR